MTEEWWKLGEKELALDEAAQQAKQLAYYNTFYGTETSRQVMLDLQRLCYTRTANSDADLARIELFNIIRTNCGASIDSEKAAIDAEAKAIT